MMRYPAHLSSQKAKEQLERYGSNTLTEKKPPSAMHLFIHQFKSPLIYILITASILTLILKDFTDTIVILLAIILNAGFGFFQEIKAQRALWALKNILAPQAKVIRDSIVHTVDARILVPEDVIIVSNGDRIPADGTVLSAVDFYVNEAIVTGESQPVQKTPDGEQNFVIMATTVSSGRATIRITETGMHTRVGTIAETLSGSVENESPLQHEIRRLAKSLAYIVIVLTSTLFFAGVLAGQDVTAMFATSVAMAVSSVPEGMAVSLTVILAVGMQKILKHKAIVRKLVSAETLGSVTTICIDKTGTLTEGVMQVVKSKIFDKKLAIYTAVLANNLNDPIEFALWDWARSQDNFDPQTVVDSFERTAELPFNSSYKYMAVAANNSAWVKGAPEILLDKCTLSSLDRKHWLDLIETYGKEGLRVLGFAVKTKHIGTLTHESLSQMKFIGIVGISDPLRTGTKEAIHITRQAGIEIKVITGDYRATSESIMSQLDIPIKNPQTEVMEGSELENISFDDLVLRIRHITLFYRVTPHQKLKIVQALQKSGETVAMTGDGVNDALAIKSADIGIVVAHASDIAKETADMILLDSNFRTITYAIEEGRAMFQNIRKVILYLLSDAFEEMFLVTGSIVLGLPLPLTAAQILWVNIVADGFPSAALAFEPKDTNLMLQKPRSKGTAIVDPHLRSLIALISMSGGLFALAVFIWAYQSTGNITYAQTLTFTIVSTSSLLYVFSCRSLDKFIFKVSPLNNPSLIGAVILGFLLQISAIYHPWMQTLFHTTPLNLFDWSIVFIIGTSIIVLIESTKFLYFHANRPLKKF